MQPSALTPEFFAFLEQRLSLRIKLLTKKNMKDSRRSGCLKRKQNKQQQPWHD
jgi:hypothetical protein